jgi:hypothetical protein
MLYQEGPGSRGPLSFCGPQRVGPPSFGRFIGPSSPPAGFFLAALARGTENRDAVPYLLNALLTRGVFALANMPSLNVSQVPE